MKNAIIIRAITALALISVSVPAFAQDATEPTLRRVERNTDATADELRDLRNDVREQSNLLIQALRLQTGEQSSYADKQIESWKRIEDAAQQNAVQRIRNQIRAEAESGKFDPDPDACLMLDLFSSPPSSPATQGAQGSNIANRVDTRQHENGLTGRGGAAGAVLEMVSPVGGREGTTTAEVFVEAPTVDLSDPVMAAAAEGFVYKLIDPLPEQQITDPQSLLDPETASWQAIQESKKARASTGQAVIAMINNMSQPRMDGEQLRKFAEGTPYNREIPDEASELQALDVMTVRHYAPSPDAGTKVQMGVTLQKLYQITAIQARMQYIALELQRRQALVDAAMIGAMTDQEGTE